MRALFICLTDYQILNAINIKVHLMKDDDADILIVNNKEGHIALAERLEKTNIFKNVYLYTEKLPGLHRYLRNVSEKEIGISFFKACKNDVINVSHKIQSVFLGSISSVNCRLWKNRKIDFALYNNVFGIDTKPIVRNCINIILQKTNNTCIVSSIDEGLASYLSKGIKASYKIDNIYLYEPDMAVYRDKFKNIIQIPKIKKNNIDFINKLNFIFNYTEKDKIKLEDKVIFFDQNWDPLPKYLQKMTWWKKIIFANPYKKHLKESSIYYKKMELFKSLVTNIKNKEIIVKLHPRSEKSFLDDYGKYNCKFLSNISAPWELFGCNCEIKNNLWVTIHSSALCSYDFSIYQPQNKNTFLFLYKLVLKNDKLFDEFDEFYKSLKNKYPNRVIIPATEQEYIHCLNFTKEK